jgi:hypothetical protein
MKRFITALIIFFPFLLVGQASWQQLESAPADGRFWAAATGNSTHGYAGTGRPEFSSLSPTSDMYAYELSTNTWTSIPDYPGGVREGMTGFTIGERVFFAFGSPFIQFTRTVYEYLPASNEWIQHPDVPGIGFAFSHGFVIGDTFYIGPENGTNQVYAFNGTTNTWSSVASFPGGDRRAQCTFSVNGKGYLGMGAGVFGGVFGDWWEYDPLSDTWTEVAEISPNSDQSSATAVGNVGYVFNVGGNGKSLNRYGQEVDEWIFESNLPTDRIANGSLFTIADQGFLVFGESTTSGGNIPSNQLWQFTPGATGLSTSHDDPLGWYAFEDANGAVTLRSRMPLSELAMVSLYTSNGELIEQGLINNAQLADLTLGNDLAAGLYMVHVRNSKSTVVVRAAVLR